MTLHFADISAWNSVNMSKYTGQVIVLRAHGETQEDLKFRAYRAAARQRGIIRGLYGFLPATGDMVAHAKSFCRAVGSVEKDEFLVCDIETGTNRTQRTLTWCRTVESILKRPVIVYATLHDVSTRSVDMRVLAPRKLWLAAWVSPEPTFPHSLWQYDNQHRPTWANGRIDMNLFHGSISDFRAQILGQQSTPKPNIKPALPVPIRVTSRSGSRPSAPLVPNAKPVPNARAVRSIYCPQLYLGATDNGDNGWVRYLQAKLGLSPNGYYGRDEWEAVRALQRRKGYPVNGRCEPHVWRSLGHVS